MSAVLETKEENVIVEFNEFESQLIKIEKDYGSRVYDLSDPAQDKAARSDRYKVAQTITALEEVRKDLKSDAQKRVKLVDGEGKKIRDRLETVRDSIKAQIDKRDQEIEDLANKLQSMVDEIRELSVFVYDESGSAFVPDSAEVQRRLDIMKNINIDDAYEDRKADATLAQVETIKQLESMLAERQKHESEQAELEKLRKEAEEREKADREERIRKDAEEKAKIEAEAERKALEEAHEAIRLEDARKALEAANAAEERARLAEEQKAKEIAEAEAKVRREAEEKEEKRIKDEAIALAEAETKRQAEEAKKAKQAHRAKIHKEAKDSFIENDIDTNDSTFLVELIKEGKIKNVIVVY